MEVAPSAKWESGAPLVLASARKHACSGNKKYRCGTVEHGPLFMLSHKLSPPPPPGSLRRETAADAAIPQRRDGAVLMAFL